MRKLDVRRGVSLSYAPRVLIVDDEPEVRNLFERVLSEDGYYTTAVGTARQALAAVRHEDFDVVILDLSLPDEDGLETTRQIRAEGPHLRILAVSGFMVGDMPSVALAAGATATLLKPTTPPTLLRTVYRLLDASGGWMGRSEMTAP
jgi:CheY-like chemotaxis protein